MSPENGRDSQRFKLAYFANCLRRAGSLKKPYFWTEWVGVAGSDVIGCTKGGLLLVWNSFSLVIPAEHNNLAKTTQKCLWCSWSQSLMVRRKQSLKEQISWENRSKTHLPSLGVLYMLSFVTNLAREFFLFLLPMALKSTTNMSVVRT